ncbi:MAG TPA: peptidoglycan DD-metalloendopeptidase family protein [Kofleriaceae bacterium]|nr:peptidoglycan DD-metalloendopeptidase family protein [Kofleriaceae bacterium]
MTTLTTLTITSFVSLLGACATSDEPVEDLNPAATLGDEQLWDEGPPAGLDTTPSTSTITADLQADASFAPSSFQVPFPCGQVWAGQSRSDHSPPNAIDFNRTNDFGDTVVASAAGTVSRVENEGNVSYGRWVEIAHGNGYTTRYAHLSVQSVHVGQAVSRGQKIGEVGSTGGSTGPHLHFEEGHNGSSIRISFNGVGALYFGTKNYTSQNSCGGGSGIVGRVDTAGAPLTIRAGASTTTADIGSVADGATVHISCQKHGQSISGTFGTTTLWDKIGAGYVSDAYVSTGSDGQVAPTCP